MDLHDDELIDVHAHFVTAEYQEAAGAAGHRLPDGMPGRPSWDPAAHLELMDRCGIGRSVLSVSSPGTHFGDAKAARALARRVNEAGIAVAREHPDRFGHFVSLPVPDAEGAVAEARYALDTLGSDGVAVLSNSGGRYLGDAALAPLWQELDERGAVVFVHPTSPACKAFGSAKVLYGSDFCWTPAAAVAAQADSLAAAEQPDGDTWRALTTRNARRLFPRFS